MAKARLVFGGRSANIDGRNTVVQGNIVQHQHHQQHHGRKKVTTPGAPAHKAQVFANQGQGYGSPKGLRGVGAVAAGQMSGYVGSPRNHRDICQHEIGRPAPERVINKPVAQQSPRRNRPYGPSPAAAAIRPPTGTGGFAANVSASLGSPTRIERRPTPMPGTMAAAQVEAPKTAGFSKVTRGYNQAQQYHQSISAPAFAAKQRAQGPPAAIQQLSDFAQISEPGRSPMRIRTNNDGHSHPTVESSCRADKHRNTLGGTRPEGGAGYLNRGHRRRVVHDNWNASTESQPHGPGMHAKAHHPLSPRRLCAISPSKVNNISTRNGEMAAIMGHAHVE